MKNLVMKTINEFNESWNKIHDIEKRKRLLAYRDYSNNDLTETEKKELEVLRECTTDINYGILAGLFNDDQEYMIYKYIKGEISGEDVLKMIKECL